VTEITATKQGVGRPENFRVRVVPLAVTSDMQRWPEDHQRERRWLPLKQVIKIVDDREICRLPKLFAAARGAQSDTSLLPV
jgi:hypothetical protein